MFSVLNVVEAWNEISWVDAVPFTLVLIGLYWVKVKIDTSLGSINKKQAKHDIKPPKYAERPLDRPKDSQTMPKPFQKPSQTLPERSPNPFPIYQKSHIS